MIDLSYTDKDGLNPAEGFVEIFDYFQEFLDFLGEFED